VLAVGKAWPSGAPGRVLLGLIVLGVALRILASISWWPTTPTLEDGYQRYATNPFLDPQHPAGYGLILAALGSVTREVAVPVLLQHLIGIVSALLLGAATRRVTGSAWAGLLPAGFVLLDADQVFLEHAVMSETWSVLFTSLGLYAAVRTFDDPEPWWRWPLAAGASLGLAATVRTASVLVIPVAVLALLMYWRRPIKHRRAPLAAAAAAALVLLAFASANAAFGERFGIEPSPGWYLYGRVAQFANCQRFAPPEGTRVLCETRPQSQRPTGYYYMFDSHAPAPRHFGSFGSNDGLIGGWARRALFAQPGDFLKTAWTYLRGYWVPGSLPAQIRSGSTGLDPQLDFTYPNVFFAADNQRDLELYYDPFTVHTRHWGLEFLHDWQRIFRFGATLLFITTVLTLIGAMIGDRRSRVGVVLFGLGGVSLIVAPALTSTYSGRYTVPLAGPLMAAAAIAICAAVRAIRARAASR
jgi:4-amino-4-deoxy-L-arabinose transferase-like glycosyltransferase